VCFLIYTFTVILLTSTVNVKRAQERSSQEVFQIDDKLNDLEKTAKVHVTLIREKVIYRDFVVD